MNDGLDYGIGWLLFDLPQIFVRDILLPFVDVMSTPFSENFGWFINFWNSLTDDKLQALLSATPFGFGAWISELTLPFLNFFKTVQTYPTLFVVLAMIVSLGLVFTLVYLILDLIEKVFPLT